MVTVEEKLVGALLSREKFETKNNSLRSTHCLPLFQSNRAILAELLLNDINGTVAPFGDAVRLRI